LNFISDDLVKDNLAAPFFFNVNYLDLLGILLENNKFVVVNILDLIFRITYELKLIDCLHLSSLVNRIQYHDSVASLV